MNKLNNAQAATPVAAPVAAPPAAAQVGTRVPSPESKPAIAGDTFVNSPASPARVAVQRGLKPAPVEAPTRSLGAKIWDGVKKGLFVGTLSAPVGGAAIFGSVLVWAGLSSLPAAAIGVGVWMAATAGIGALWGSKQK